MHDANASKQIDMSLNCQNLFVYCATPILLQVLLMLLAGYDTSANTLSFTTYSLARACNADIQVSILHHCTMYVYSRCLFSSWNPDLMSSQRADVCEWSCRKIRKCYIWHKVGILGRSFLEMLHNKYTAVQWIFGLSPDSCLHQWYNLTVPVTKHM